MVDRAALLADLQQLLRKLEADLLERADSPEVVEVGEWLRREYQQAKRADRTDQTYKQWLDRFITQVASAWVLSCVFVRFLEDNSLIEPPRIAGVGERLGLARDEHTLFFQDPERARLTDREYLLDIFADLARLPAVQELFGPHNGVNAVPNWLGPDAAGELLRFFQRIDSDTGALEHDFTDPDWGTRFLGDLYQDLSPSARKKYALLQTPEFVEEFILDRTLEPALDEFGVDAAAVISQEGQPISRPGFRLIDPACGSGHFLLGAFPRILTRWQRQEPAANVRDLIQRTLHAIHGVDINPFAIAIARFRLLLAALRASGVSRLVNAPAYDLNLACGDSLYHGRRRQLALDNDWTDESHCFRTEDTDRVRGILQEGTFHAVVANPPYITPKDKAANRAYRRLYPSCHMKYSLSVPFMERIFQLAVAHPVAAGYTGQITANSFMKREFGKKLVEEYFKQVDLTHIIDTSGAYIPGHGTPTVVLFGRNRAPQGDSVRTLLGIIGEPGTPDSPADGQVWRAILKQIDQSQSQSKFMSCVDTGRDVLASHPWTLRGGGAVECKERIESAAAGLLSDYASPIGFSAIPSEDEAFVLPRHAAQRARLPARRFVTGDSVRDWAVSSAEWIVFPYDDSDAVRPVGLSAGSPMLKHFWPRRSVLRARTMFGKSIEQHGCRWHEFMQLIHSRVRADRLIAFANVATHNQFSFVRRGQISNQNVNIIQLRDATFSQQRWLAVFNSSTCCFWIKQVCHNKGSTVDARGARQRTVPFEDYWQIDGTKMKAFPVPGQADEALEGLLKRRCDELVDLGDVAAVDCVVEGASRKDFDGRRVDLQEELDWACYRLYGLLDDDLTHAGEPLDIRLGQRAFEIVLARQMARGEVQTTWFERHGSTPITQLPEHWPDDYKALVERRIDVIDTNPHVGLIEQPEYKRRWKTESSPSRSQRTLRDWLVDRLERHFDFDGRMSDGEPPATAFDVGLVSVAMVADVARQDQEFMRVAEAYRQDPAFDVQRLVDELIHAEQVPLLPVLRYKANGLRNRAEWEAAWELQRLEDRLRSGAAVELADYPVTDEQRQAIAAWQRDTAGEQKRVDPALDAILAIAAPPKYKSSDFVSAGGARYWALRGKLDVPKERWVSFPYCEGADGTLMIAWAGYDHLQLARAISAFYVDVQERLGGRDDPRLTPLLAAVVELLPWLRQWHHDIDPEFNQRMDEVFAGFVAEEAKSLGLTLDDVAAWQPPKR